jgi:hypothetical protein
MKHDHSMLSGYEPTARTESRFVRYLHPILMYAAQALRLARSSQSVDVRKERCMADLPEIPTDEEVLAALEASDGGLTPSQLMAVLEAEHSRDNIIRAIQRVMDRGKVRLSDGARMIPTPVDELAIA